MKLLFALILLAGFGYWMTKEIEHEKDLQAQLDEARTQLADTKKTLDLVHQQMAQGRSSSPQMQGISQDKQWMYKTNPLNLPAHK